MSMEPIGYGVRRILDDLPLSPEMEARLRQHFGAVHRGENPSISQLLQDLREISPYETSRFIRGFVRSFVGESDWEQESIRRQNIERARREFDIDILCLLRSGIPEGVKSFADFKARPKFKAVQEALDTVQAWMEGTTPGLLTLAGGVGTGKSHLARAAAMTLAIRSEVVVYREEAALIGELQRHVKPGTLDDAMAELARVPWLILDEMGATSLTDWGRSQMDTLINARYDNAGWARTLITTNLTGDDLPPRIASRLADVERARTVLIKAPDYRRTGGKD